MRVALLCPGPSLGKLDAVPACDVSLAINRAALRFPVTWFAATDYPVIRNHYEHLPGTPNLLTRRQTFQDIHHRLARFPEVKLVEDIRPVPDGPEWQLKTLTCAMVFAGFLGATTIDVWGCDLQGTADYDGVQAGEDRSPERWAKEARDFAVVAAWLAGRGCEVRRESRERV